MVFFPVYRRLYTPNNALIKDINALDINTDGKWEIKVKPASYVYGRNTWYDTACFGGHTENGILTADVFLFFLPGGTGSNFYPQMHNWRLDND